MHRSPGFNVISMKCWFSSGFIFALFVPTKVGNCVLTGGFDLIVSSSHQEFNGKISGLCCSKVG